MRYATGVLTMSELLLVEDDVYVTEMLAAGIETFYGAATMLAVHNGTAASSIMQSRHFDLAIIDVCLPDVSGFKVASQAANSNLPALLMTGHPDLQDICEVLGFPYLSKPFLVTTLMERAVGISHAVEENIIQILRSYDRYLSLEAQGRRLRQRSLAIISDSQRILLSSLTRLPPSAIRVVPNRGAGRKPI